MDIKKAIVTAAGKLQATLPLQTLVDKDGVEKTALRILIEEVLGAGVEELCVVVRPGDEPAYRMAAGDLAGRLQFATQSQPRGYGHAVWCARDFTADEPFLLLVSDHLYVHHGHTSCARQLVEIAVGENCAVSAVHPTHESKLPYYGAIGGQLVAGRHGLYQVSRLMEKPTPTVAEQQLVVPGLRTGHYLCFFGMHVLTPTVMELLDAALRSIAEEASLQLTTALGNLVGSERYLASELDGRRYDIGVKYGLLNAQLALALEGDDRDEVLANLVELLALRQTGPHPGTERSES